MSCGCEASRPCEAESLLTATQIQQAEPPMEVSFSLCADCGGGTTDFVPAFVVALVLTALLRALRRRPQILTLGLSDGRVVRRDPSVADLHHPAGALRERGVVRDDDQRPAGFPELGKERHDVAA